MRAPSIARQGGLEVDAQDRVVVGTDLRSVSHPSILAVGDSAHPNGPTGAPFRPSALTAAVSGVYPAIRDAFLIACNECPLGAISGHSQSQKYTGRHGPDLNKASGDATEQAVKGRRKKFADLLKPGALFLVFCMPR